MFHVQLLVRDIQGTVVHLVCFCVFSSAFCLWTGLKELIGGKGSD